MKRASATRGIRFLTGTRDSVRVSLTSRTIPCQGSFSQNLIRVFSSAPKDTQKVVVGKSEAEGPIIKTVEVPPVSEIPATAASQKEVKKWKHPLVLCHGLLGFDTLKLGLWELPYWGGAILATLKEHGEVFVARVSPTADVSVRANELKQQIEAFLQTHHAKGFTKVNILGHSMGGLDARYFVSRLGGHELVSSISTLATPHRGSTFADWMLTHVGEGLKIQHMLRVLRIPTEAFLNLTIENMKKFNTEVLDHPNVKYYSYAAVKERDQVPLFLRLSYDVIYDAEGPNDILVSELSAKWGKHVETIDFDHLEQINLSLPPFIRPKADTPPLSKNGQLYR